MVKQPTLQRKTQLLTISLSLVLALSAGVTPPAAPQKRGVIVAPTWLTAKWTYDDRGFKAIRLKLDRLWRERPMNVAAIEDLYVKHVLPHRDEYARARSGKIDPQNYYWLIALESYFGQLGILGKHRAMLNKGYILDVAAPPPSYEFARVAFGIYVVDGLYRMRDFSVADRLLAKWPDDLLVRKDTIQLGTMISGSTTAWKRSLRMAEELTQDFPNAVDVSLPSLELANFIAWRVTKEAAYLRRTVKVLDDMLTRKEPYFLKWHNSYLSRKRRCAEEAKEAGIKL